MSILEKILMFNMSYNKPFNGILLQNIIILSDHQMFGFTHSAIQPILSSLENISMERISRNVYNERDMI